jgi:pilus assembly protein FimV
VNASAAAASGEDLVPLLLDDLLQAPPVLVAAVAALLLSLVFVIRYRRRRRALGEKIMETEGVQSMFAQAGGRNVDTSNSVFHSNFVPSVSQLDTNEVDAVAEADVYIAYGRDEQAEEILQDSLRLHPDRHALRVKLLEIYATRKDRQKFGTLAAELRVLTHGVGDAWTQAAQMGRVLDPGNLLFGVASVEGSTARTDRAVFSGLPVSSSMPKPTPSTVVKPSALSSAIPPAESSVLPSPVSDFEFRLESLLGEQRTDVVMESASANQLGQQVVTGKAALVDVVRGDGAVSDMNRSPLLEFDLSGLPTSIPLPGSASTTIVQTQPPADLSDTDARIAALQTKLDLAIACEEIGDTEGARELLTEVACGPYAVLAQRAQSLLGQLA